MKKNNVRKKGFALLLTMIMISLIVTVTTFIVYRSMLVLPYIKATLHKEKAQQLALGGIQAAMSVLGKKPVEKKDEKLAKEKIDNSGQANDEKAMAQALMEELLPILGQWQDIRLRKKIDGVEGSISFCITAESGKININSLYDFDKHQFKEEQSAQKKESTIGEKAKLDPVGSVSEKGSLVAPDGKPAIKKQSKKELLKEVLTFLEKQSTAKNLFKSLEKFLKKRTQPLEDVSELLRIPEFAPLVDYLCYEPQREQKEKEKSGAARVFLMDVFTVAKENDIINPWLLSDGIRAIFGMQRILPVASEKRKESKEKIKKLLKQFTLSTDWAKKWDQLLAPRYKKEYNKLSSGITSLIEAKFSPRMFSVVSEGTYAGVTQKLCAFVERAVEQKKNKNSICFTIKKLYWL